MCGIAGLVSVSSSPVEVDVLRRMAEALAPRGPDEQQVWIDPANAGVGLAHSRLVVLDREGGGQPMGDAAGVGRRVVFNGEIYNHVGLRAALGARGHRFASDHSDTEVLLPLYDEYGPGMVGPLRGMFALAVYDGPGRRLFLARDRMGQKPLYWARTGSHFAFASELKALLRVPGVGRRVDLGALDLYLQLGYVPSPRTIFEGVQKLAPGTRMVVPLDNVPRDPAPEVYWSPPLPAAEDETSEVAAVAELLGHRGDLVGEVRRRLAEAVTVRLEADVPLGFFLSGGLDSSLVLALARQAAPDRTLRTFSVAFPDLRYDESRYAAMMALAVGAEHTSLEVRPGSLGAWLPAAVAMFDEPFADSSALPTALMARAAREHITVALSGDGGDEAFGGYDRYRAVRVAAALDRRPWLRRRVGACGRLVPRGRDLKSRRSRLRRFTDVLGLDPLGRYARWVSPFHESDPMELYSDRFCRAVGEGGALGYLGRFVPEGRRLEDVVAHLGAGTYLPEDVLTKVDRASMAHGLEVRSPLLDHEVVELAMGLPARLRLRKALLREAAAPVVPKEILSRRKMGFGVPVSAWLAGPEAGLVTERLTGGPLAASGLLDAAVLAGYVDEHIRRRADHGPRLYALLVLDEFLRTSGAEIDL